MKKENYTQTSAHVFGQYKELIKELARQQYLQEEMGTGADFEKLWRAAFPENGTSDVPKKSSN